MFAMMLGLLMVSACTSKTKLEIAIAAANSECPTDLGDGVTLMKMYTEADAVVYEYVCDEMESEMSVVDMEDPYVRAVLKESIIEDLKEDTDKDVIEMLNLVKDAQYNIIYRFIGSHTGHKLDITCYPHEL